MRVHALRSIPLLLSLGCASTGGVGRPSSPEDARNVIASAAAALQATPLPEEYAELPRELRALYEELPTSPTPGRLWDEARALDPKSLSPLGRLLHHVIPRVTDGMPADPEQARSKLLAAVLLSLGAAELVAPPTAELLAGGTPQPQPQPASIPPGRRVQAQLLARSLGSGAPPAALASAAAVRGLELLSRGDLQPGLQLVRAAQLLVAGDGLQTLQGIELWYLLALARLDEAEAQHARVAAGLTADQEELWGKRLPLGRSRASLLAAQEDADRERQLAVAELQLGMSWAALARVDRAIEKFPDDARLVDVRFWLGFLEKGTGAVFDVARIEQAGLRPVADAQSWELRAYARCSGMFREVKEHQDRGDAIAPLAVVFGSWEQFLAASPALQRENPPVYELLQLELKLLRAHAGLPGEKLDPGAWANAVVGLAVRSPRCTPCWRAALPASSMLGGGARDSLLLAPTLAPEHLRRDEIRKELLTARLETALSLAPFEPALAERYRVAAIEGAEGNEKEVAKAYSEVTRSYASLLWGSSSSEQGGAEIAAAAARGLAAGGGDGALKQQLQNFRIVGLGLQSRDEAAALEGLEAFPETQDTALLVPRLNALAASAKLGRQPAATADALKRLRAGGVDLASSPDFGAPLRLLEFLEPFARSGGKNASAYGPFVAALPRSEALVLLLGLARSYDAPQSCAANLSIPDPGSSTRFGLGVAFHPWMLGTLNPGSIKKPADPGPAAASPAP